MTPPKRLIGLLLLATAVMTAHTAQRSVRAGEAELAATAALVTGVAVYAAHEFLKPPQRVGDRS